MLNTGIFCDYCHSKIFEKDRSCPHCGAPTKSAIVVKENSKNKSDDYSISFIAGTKQTLNFNIFDEDGLIVKSGNIIWDLSPYGSCENILSKTSITNKGKATINLVEQDTRNLSGKFIQSVRFEKNGTKFFATQGAINIYNITR